MYLSALRFFKENEDIKNQNMLVNMNLMAANLKNNTLRWMLYAYLQQELGRLTREKKSNQDKAKKQKRLFARLKLSLNKRQAKKRSQLRNDFKIEPVQAKQKRTKPSIQCSMR